MYKTYPYCWNSEPNPGAGRREPGAISRGGVGEVFGRAKMCPEEDFVVLYLFSVPTLQALHPTFGYNVQCAFEANWNKNAQSLVLEAKCEA